MALNVPTPNPAPVSLCLHPNFLVPHSSVLVPQSQFPFFFPSHLLSKLSLVCLLQFGSHACIQLALCHKMFKVEGCKGQSICVLTQQECFPHLQYSLILYSCVCARPGSLLQGNLGFHLVLLQLMYLRPFSISFSCLKMMSWS